MGRNQVLLLASTADLPELTKRKKILAIKPVSLSSGHQKYFPLVKAELAMQASLQYRGRGLGRDGADAGVDRQTPASRMDQS